MTGMGLLLVGGCLGVLLQVILHEAGHLALGLATGYRLSSFAVLCLRISRREGGWSVGLAPVSGAGGQCAMEPAFPMSREIPWFWYNAGGVLFNLAAAGLLAGVGTQLEAGSALRGILLLTAAVGLLFGVSNGIPTGGQQLANDADQILLLAKCPETREAYWKIMKIHGETARGRRLADLPEAWFADLGEGEAGNHLLAGLAADRIARALERREYSLALDQCRRLMAAKGVPLLFRQEAQWEAAFCRIMLGQGSWQEAWVLQRRGRGRRLSPLSSYHTQYAYAAFVEGNLPKAEGIHQAFLRAGKGEGNRGMALHEQALFQGLIERASNGA